MKVGDIVKARTDLIEPVSDHAPASLYAKAGDVLVVRKVLDTDNSKLQYTVGVSHEDRTDAFFWAAPSELEWMPQLPLDLN